MKKNSFQFSNGRKTTPNVLREDKDARLQQLEQRDFTAKGLTILERIKLFFQIKFNLIPIQEYRKMEAVIYHALDEIKELQKRFGGES